MTDSDRVTLVAALLGAVSGAAVTVLWEAVFKPRRERRAIAHALATEVEINMQAAEKMLLEMRRRPTMVPTGFEFHTALYRALSARVGELSDETLPELTLFYAGAEGTNRVVNEVRGLSEQLRVARGSPPPGTVLADLERQFTTGRNLIAENLEIAVRRGHRLLPMLRVASLRALSWRQSAMVISGNEAPQTAQVCSSPTVARRDSWGLPSPRR